MKLAGFPLRYLLSATALFAAAVGVASLPCFRLGAAALAAGASLLVWRRPAAAFFIAPLATGIVDFTPWTGRCYFNEWDACLLAALAAAYASGPLESPRANRWDVAALGLILLSLLASMAIAWGTTPTNQNTLYGVYDLPANAWRTGRPLFYALASWGLLVTLGEVRRTAVGWYAAGAACGLACTVAAVAWERLRFCGLIDLESGFRVTGPFAAMHNGGAALDAYLVAAIPLLAVVWAVRRDRVVRIGLGALLVGSLYAVVVTLSRTPVVVLAIQAVLWCVLTRFVQPRSRLRGPSPRGVAALLLVAALGLLAATPQLLQRFSDLSADAGVRWRHWGRCAATLAGRRAEQLLGAGCGAFPQTFRERALGNSAANYRFVGEGKQRRLVLTGGKAPIYFGQYVRVSPQTDYTLVLRARRMQEEGDVAVSLTEKNLLQSYESVDLGRQLKDAPVGAWTTVRRPFNSGPVGRQIERPPFTRQARPVWLSLWATTGAAVEIASVQLLDQEGGELIANGDFQSGHDRWWWTSDDHLAWQAKNLWVQLFVEQGALGLLAVLLASAWVVVRLGTDVANGRPAAAPLLCALAGLLGVGMIDAWTDAPRILLTYLLLLGLALLAHEGTTTCNQNYGLAEPDT